MFYFFIDGERLLTQFVGLFPLNNQDEHDILSDMAAATRATLQGALLIALIQGILGGVVLWLANVQSPLFWMVIMIVLSLIPSVGTAVILVPTSFILMLTDHILWGCFVLVCAMLISILDNLLRPRLVAQGLKMHDLIIFFSTLGGISLFGLPGFVLGPVIASLLMSLLRIYQKTYTEISVPEPATVITPSVTQGSQSINLASRTIRRSPGRRKPNNRPDS